MISLNAKKTKQAGWSLVEFAVVAALIAAGIAFVLHQKSGQNTSEKVTEEVQQETNLISGIRTYYSGAKIYTGLDNSVALKVGPSSMNLNGSLVNGFKQPVTVAAATVNGIADLGFTITTNLSTESCQQVVSLMDSQLVQISVAGTPVKALNGTLDRNALINQCSAAPNTPISVVFTSL